MLAGRAPACAHGAGLRSRRRNPEEPRRRTGAHRAPADPLGPRQCSKDVRPRSTPAPASHRRALEPVPASAPDVAAPRPRELWLAAHFPRLPLDALLPGTGQARAAAVTAIDDPAPFHRRLQRARRPPGRRARHESQRSPRPGAGASGRGAQAPRGSGAARSPGTLGAPVHARRRASSRPPRCWPKCAAASICSAASWRSGGERSRVFPQAACRPRSRSRPRRARHSGSRARISR